MLQRPYLPSLRKIASRIDEIELRLKCWVEHHPGSGDPQDPACSRPFGCDLWELRSPRQFMRLRQVAIVSDQFDELNLIIKFSAHFLHISAPLQPCQQGESLIKVAGSPCWHGCKGAEMCRK